MAGGIYYFAVQKPGQPEQPQPVLPTQSKQQSFPIDETADWKTYRNEEWGFEIKYPENWYLTTHVTETPRRRFLIIFENYPLEKLSKNVENFEQIWLLIDERSITESLEYYKKEKAKIKEINVGQKRGYEIITSEGVYFFVSKDKYLYSLRLLEIDESLTLKIFSQMLSTFKFIE